MSLLSDCYIAYVNLDHRTDRREALSYELTKHLNGYQVSRQRGMYPNEWPEYAKRMTAMLARPQVGAIGCYMSQLAIIEKAFIKNKHALVLEDDLVFCSDFGKRIDYVDNWTKTHEWDILWLGATFHVGKPWWHGHDIGRDAETTDDIRMLRTFGSFCTYSYIINRESIAEVMRLLDEFLPKSIGIDHSMINISPQLKTFAFVPGLIKQYNNLSDQIPGSGAITEFERFSQLNGTIENSAYWWQNKMEDFNPETFDWKEAKIK